MCVCVCVRVCVCVWCVFSVSFFFGGVRRGRRGVSPLSPSGREVAGWDAVSCLRVWVALCLLEVENNWKGGNARDIPQRSPGVDGLS